MQRTDTRKIHLRRLVAGRGLRICRDCHAPESGSACTPPCSDSVLVVTPADVVQIANVNYPVDILVVKDGQHVNCVHQLYPTLARRWTQTGAQSILLVRCW
jgi:hypothetical protein